MGLQIEVPGNFLYYSEINKYPVLRALTSLYYLGTSAQESILNRADGMPNAVAGGGISYFNGYARFTGEPTTNNLQTQDLENAIDMTIVGVYRSPTARPDPDILRRGIFSAFQSFEPGVSMFATGVFVPSSVGGGPANLSFYPGVYPLGGFEWHATRYQDGQIQLFNAIGGVVTMVNSTAITRARNTTRPIRIGGDYQVGDYATEMHISSVAKHDVALTLQELQETYDFHKSRMQKLGINLA